MLVTVNKSKLNFSYETLERATNYFDNSNKLGQGGSGSVYKVLYPLSLLVIVFKICAQTLTGAVCNRGFCQMAKLWR